MKLLKKREEAPAATPATLKQRIEQTCAEAAQYVEQYVDKLKQSDDGKLLPRDWLLLDTRLQFGRCNCRCA